jgi:hypothetical protein
VKDESGYLLKGGTGLNVYSGELLEMNALTRAWPKSEKEVELQNG